MMSWDTFRTMFLDAGIPDETLVALAGIETVTRDGETFLCFYETLADDVVLWCPATGKLEADRGRAIALGDDNISNAATYSFDCFLHLYTDPWDWLRDKGRGAVILDWSRAFERLRHAPRIAVDERLLATYRKHMVPTLPELAVLTASGSWRAAA